MHSFFTQYVIPHFNFWISLILMMIGLYAMITKNNLIKKLIGMSIFQTAIILFFVSTGVKSGATIPILEHHAPSEEAAVHAPDDDHAVQPHKGGDAEKTDAGEARQVHSEQKGGHAEGGGHHEINPDHYSNPLPHVLMLTAIVVGVATLGVALAVAQVIYRNYGTLEEDEILTKIKAAESDG